jgi:hypothetical protein
LERMVGFASLYLGGPTHPTILYTTNSSELSIRAMCGAAQAALQGTR